MENPCSILGIRSRQLALAIRLATSIDDDTLDSVLPDTQWRDKCRLLPGQYDNLCSLCKVHNITAGTDIFSFRILHTMQYLVHGLT